MLGLITLFCVFPQNGFWPPLYVSQRADKTIPDSTSFSDRVDADQFERKSPYLRIIEKFHTDSTASKGNDLIFFIDTININNPVIVQPTGYRTAHQFIMPDSTLAKYNESMDFLIDNPNVFILADDVSSLALGLLTNNEMYKYWLLGDGNEFESEKVAFKSKRIEVYRYTAQPDYYLLMLVRGDIYIHQTEHVLVEYNVLPAGKKRLEFKVPYGYYKIVVPCKNYPDIYQPKDKQQ